MSSTAAAANGDAPTNMVALATSHEGIEARLAGELETELRAQRQELVLLEATVTAAREREKRLARSLAALRPEPTAPPVQGDPGKRRREAKMSRKQYVSDKMIERVFAALEAAGEPLNARMTRAAAGASEPSTRAALEELRAQERVRVARVDKALGTFYAPMDAIESPSSGTDA